MVNSFIDYRQLSIYNNGMSLVETKSDTKYITKNDLGF